MNDTHRLYAGLPDGIVPKVYAETNTAALVRNYKKLTAGFPAGVKPCCVVKADAYGHGAKFCVPALAEAGCRFFAVSSPEEATEVRSLCRGIGIDADILILGFSDPANVGTLAENGIIQACFSADYARELSDAAAGKTLRIHIKLDTGMNRIGFPTQTEEDRARTAEEIRAVSGLPGIRIDGIFSHFAKADEDTVEGRDRTRLQTERFIKTTELVKAYGIDVGTRHICNTAGSMLSDAPYLDACRLGIGLYGMDPSADFHRDLEPVLRLCAKVAQVHTLHKGESVSYGGDFTAEHEMKLATMPIGYADGFIRAYRGAEAVIYSPEGIKKCKAVNIGRICMDQCMFDVTGTDVRPGDTAVLMGEPGQTDALAALAGTINYECTCILSSRVLRILRDKTNND